MSAVTSDSISHYRTCPLCEGMCGVEVKITAGRIESIRPDKDNVWSRGHICPKGTTLGALHDDKDRIRNPMIRAPCLQLRLGRLLQVVDRRSPARRPER